MNFSGSGNSKLLIKFLLLGEHFPNKSELTFSQITFKTFALDEWLGISGFTTNHDFEKEILDIHFIPPATIQKKINDEITLSVKFTWSGFPLRPLNSIEVSQKGYLCLDYSSEKQLEELLISVYRIKNLLSLAVGKPLSLLETTIRKSSTKKGVDDDEFLQSINVYYESIPSFAPEKKFYEHEMVFKFQDIKEQLSMILNTWLFMYEKLEPAINLYFSTINNEELYIDNKFLSFIQGLETFHRRITDNQSISEREHQDRISKILIRYLSNIGTG